MDLDPDPAIFVVDLQYANKDLIKKKVFLLRYYFSKVRYIYIIFKIKNPKEVTKHYSKNQGFSYY
jgi:hypothetical protein